MDKRDKVCTEGTESAQSQTDFGQLVDDGNDPRELALEQMRDMTEQMNRAMLALMPCSPTVH
jgi:hypothetical protein